MTGLPIPLGDNKTDQSLQDWQRGNRGWGSGAALAGPCDAPAGINFQPTPYQQNPCVFVNWLATWILGNPDPSIEVEEAAADMFLNWVFRMPALTTPVDFGDEGFENAIWADWFNPTFQTQGDTFHIYPAAAGPGDDRYIWMTDILGQLFVYYGW